MVRWNCCLDAQHADNYSICSANRKTYHFNHFFIPLPDMYREIGVSRYLPHLRMRINVLADCVNICAMMTTQVTSCTYRAVNLFNKIAQASMPHGGLYVRNC